MINAECMAKQADKANVENQSRQLQLPEKLDTVKDFVIREIVSDWEDQIMSSIDEMSRIGRYTIKTKLSIQLADIITLLKKWYPACTIDEIPNLGIDDITGIVHDAVISICSSLSDAGYKLVYDDQGNTFDVFCSHREIRHGIEYLLPYELKLRAMSKLSSLLRYEDVVFEQHSPLGISWKPKDKQRPTTEHTVSNSQNKVRS